MILVSKKKNRSSMSQWCSGNLDLGHSTVLCPWTSVFKLASVNVLCMYISVTFQLMLYIDTSLLLHKWEFIIKIMKKPLWRLQINCLFRRKEKLIRSLLQDHKLGRLYYWSFFSKLNSWSIRTSEYAIFAFHWQNVVSAKFSNLVLLSKFSLSITK